MKKNEFVKTVRHKAGMYYIPLMAKCALALMTLFFVSFLAYYKGVTATPVIQFDALTIILSVWVTTGFFVYGISRKEEDVLEKVLTKIAKEEKRKIASYHKFQGEFLVEINKLFDIYEALLPKIFKLGVEEAENAKEELLTQYYLVEEYVRSTYAGESQKPLALRVFLYTTIKPKVELLLVKIKNLTSYNGQQEEVESMRLAFQKLINEITVASGKFVHEQVEKEAEIKKAANYLLSSGKYATVS